MSLFDDGLDDLGFDTGDGGGGGDGVDTAFLQSEIDGLSAAFVHFVTFVVALLKLVVGFLNLLWTSFLKTALLDIWNALKTAFQWIEAKLQPIIQFLKRVRALYDAWFNTYLRPILQMIQRVRQFLQLLSLLHIQIAAQLDNWLAQLENKLAQTFLTFRAAINGAIDLLTLISDPSLLLRKPTLIISLRRTLPAIIRATTGLPPGFFFPSPLGAQSKYFAPVPANFDPRNTAMNPPPSFYLGEDDGLEDVQPLILGFAPGDGAVDDIGILDFFDDELYPVSTCSDPTQCIQTAVNLGIATIQAQ